MASISHGRSVTFTSTRPPVRITRANVAHELKRLGSKAGKRRRQGEKDLEFARRILEELEKRTVPAKRRLSHWLDLALACHNLIALLQSDALRASRRPANEGPPPAATA
jgi:hypothetical protein